MRGIVDGWTRNRCRFPTEVPISQLIAREGYAGMMAKAQFAILCEHLFIIAD